MNLIQNHSKRFNLLLLLIASSMFFMKTCTWLTIIFVVYNLIYIKKIQFDKKIIYKGLLIAAPLILEILMFWNNDSFILGLKSIEKSLTLLLFPIFIIGNYNIINTERLLKNYSVVSTILLILFFIRFIIFYPILIKKYINGIDLIEMGYKYAESIGIHAPALNMHVVFISLINLYFLIKRYSSSKLWINISNLFFFIFSFFFVLFINTRTALICFTVSFIFMVFYQFKFYENYKKSIINILLITFLSLITFFFYLKNNPYMVEKYTKVTFGHMDKIGRLDEIKDPQIHVFNSLVTRISIWKSSLELSKNHLLFGFGASDNKKELISYYKKTNQKFLAKYEFPVHNQILDFLLKYGILGVITFFIYIGNIFFLGLKLKNEIVLSFFIIFFISNLTDDFLIRFDGIVFSGFWISIFSCMLLKKIYND